MMKKKPGQRIQLLALLALLLLAASPLMADGCLDGEWWSISDDHFLENCKHLASGTIEERSQLAWMLFARLNQPVATSSAVQTEWELWATDPDTFTDHPFWPSKETRPKQLQAVNKALGSSAKQVQEVTRNRLAYDYVTTGSHAFHDETLIQAVVNNETIIDFPLTSLEIKAKWTHSPLRGMYLGASKSHSIIGLEGLHVMWKFHRPEDPATEHSWFWATFEFKNNPQRADALRFITYRDEYGDEAAQKLLEEAGLGEPWTNYRLNGTQIEFVTSEGQPVILGNTTMENEFAYCGEALCPSGTPSSQWTSWQASCHTCHYLAAQDANEDFPDFNEGPIGMPVLSQEFWRFDFDWGVIIDAKGSASPGN